MAAAVTAAGVPAPARAAGIIDPLPLYELNIVGSPPNVRFIAESVGVGFLASGTYVVILIRQRNREKNQR